MDKAWGESTSILYNHIIPISKHETKSIFAARSLLPLGSGGCEVDAIVIFP